MASNPYDGMSVPMGDVPPPPAPPVATTSRRCRTSPGSSRCRTSRGTSSSRRSPQPPPRHALTLAEGQHGGRRSRFAALWKFKVLALLLKLKFLTFAGSMMISFAAYALFYGWTFAARTGGPARGARVRPRRSC